MLRGVLRKKGVIFFNERDVTLSHDGILNYYHFDKLGEAKGNINLKSANVSSIRFIYANTKQGATV